MVGGIHHLHDFWKMVAEDAHDALPQRLVHHPTALAAAAKTHDRDPFRLKLDKLDPPAVTGEVRVDLALDEVAHPVGERRLRTERNTPKPRRPNAERSTRTFGLKVDARTFEVGKRIGLDPKSEAVAGNRDLAAAELRGSAELKAAVRRGGAAANHREPYAKLRLLLSFDQPAEMRLCRFADFDHCLADRCCHRPHSRLFEVAPT